MAKTELFETRLLGYEPLDSDFVTTMIAGLLGDRPLIVEEAVDVVATWCEGLAITHKGTVCFGSAEQVFAAPGQQSGSVIDPANVPPPEIPRLAEMVGEAKNLSHCAVRRG